MATKAYHHATLDGTKAEGCYHLGRAYHAAGDYEMALKYYSEATINWPQFPLPHYGLGQLYLARKQYLQAIENLQKVDSKYLDIPEVKNLLGHTYAQLIDAPSTSSSKIVEYREKAVSYFERSLKLSPHQPDIWIELAQVCQYFEPLQALRAYENASDLLNSVHAYKKLFSNPADPKNPSHEPTPPPSDEAVIDLLKKLPTPCRQLWNNIGVLLITLKDFHRALDVFLRTILAGACYSCIRSSPPAILPTHAVLFDSFYKSPSPRSRSSTSPLKTVFAPPSFSSPSSSIDLSLIRLALYAKSIKDPLDSSQHKLLFRACLDNEWLLLPQNVTVAFNLAYLHETGLHDINTAHLLYERILQRYPGYLDAIFRLACIERDFGQVSRAIDQFSKVYQGEWSCLPTATPDRHKTACIYLANIHMHLKDYKSAQSYLEKFLNQHTADKKKLTSGQATIDLYALTQLANIFLIAAAIPNDRRERNLKYATDLFSSVLKQSPGNLYATNGLGITLALRGTPTHYQNATDIFHAVREGSSSIPDVFINLGHVYFIQGDHYQAIRMYSNFLTKFGPHLPQVSQSRLFTMLSRCYFETGNFELAKFTLQHSLHLNPSDNDTWYNLAVMCKDLGLSVLKHVDSNFTPSNDGLEPSNIHKSSSSKYVSVPTEAEQRAAIEALKVATPIFERLHTDASSSTSKHSFIPSKCSKFAKLCSTNRELAEEKLAAFKEEQLRLSQLREARLSEAREREAQRLQELELKRAHELRRIKELELQAKEYIQRTAALQQEWAASHDDKKSNDSNDDLDDGVISVPKKRRRKQEESLESSLKKTSSLNHE
ncbi:RNA polymerase-associated protein CTR9 homolog [Schistocerca gregaria]|uniref:RNA polymerase-associated protein CTR9 homolog n=1 Tax=Schistocerca gregaria TaxID=7010 RepID=UPI00211E63EB|nr:RNA polymerase-associated protein CTR9 homolog [Schistocerca gregaria]